MSKIKIEGGYKLTGKIEISGAKNSAVALVPAAILCDEEVTISNVPNISDIDSLEEILNYLKPKHVILAHWENFFIPRTGLYQKPAQVPFTNVKRFLNSYKKSAKKLAINDFTMPISDTEIKFKF